MRIYNLGLGYQPIKRYNNTPQNKYRLQTKNGLSPCADTTTYFCGRKSSKMSDKEFKKLKREISLLCEKYEDEADLSNLQKVLTKENIVFAKSLLEKENFPKHEIYAITHRTNNKNLRLAIMLCDDDNVPKYQIAKILNNTTKNNLNFTEQMYKTKDFPVNLLHELLEYIGEDAQYYGVNEIQGLPYYVKMYRQCIKNSYKYVNCEEGNNNKFNNLINKYFTQKGSDLIKLASLQDDELNDILLRKRFLEMNDYLRIIHSFTDAQMDILRLGLKCKTPENKRLSQPEKVMLIEIINAYKLTHQNFSPIKEMISYGVLDIQKLKKDIMLNIFNSLVYKEENSKELISEEKLLSWDKNYTHLLASQLHKKGAKNILNVIKLANQPQDFKELIRKKSGNQYTEWEFNNYNLDYKKWLTPSKANEIRIITEDNNLRQVKEIANQFSQNVNELLQSPASIFITKKYPKYIKDNTFSLPEEICSNKNKLVIFIKNFDEELNPVWKRAQKNENTQSAQKTLNIRENIAELNKRLETILSNSEQKSIDVTIKMWDRIPQHDLFQGNYSTCCIGMNKVNAQVMEPYLMKTVFNMIEIINNITGQTVGNALCYYAKENYKPIFIIDNIEINNSFKPSNEICEKIRDGITEYSKNLNKEVTGNNNTPIYLGGHPNDVPVANLKQEDCFILGLIGSIWSVDSRIYLDAYDGWIERNDTQDQILKLYKLTD